MAASVMFRCRHCSRLRLSQYRQASTKAYYVLLPEVPPDTPETNAVLRYDEQPNFNEITPGKILTGCAKLAIQYDVGLGNHMEKLKEPDTKKNFESVFEPIEKLSIPLNYAWRVSKLMNYVKGDDYQKAFQRIHPKVARARNERWTNQLLYQAVKEVAADSRNLTETQKRVVDMYKLDAKQNGIELEGREKSVFVELLGQIVESSGHFRNRVMISHNMFKHAIEDFSLIVEMPKDLSTKMSMDKTNPSRGPWKVTLNDDVYKPFLEYCPNRMHRWNVWQAYNKRASLEGSERNLSNSSTIKDLRHYRKRIAKMLGYENFAAMSMETKMAGSVENVLNMIETLKGKFYEQALEELSQLQEYAVYEGFQSSLEMWDLPYWRRRKREQLYNIDAGVVAEHFPFPKVLDRLFGLCNTLFGIDIKERAGDSNIWHADVRVFDVFDSESGNRIAYFYMDPYARGDKLQGTWMEPGSDYSELLGTIPMSYLNLSLAPPYGSSPSLMSLGDVEKLFYTFGHGLQQMLTRAPHSEVAGQQNIEWDSIQTCANVMKMILYNPTILKRISSHVETGASLPDDIITDITKSRNHMSAYDMMSELYLAAFDMEMYISDEHWNTVLKSVWPEFMPIPLAQDDNHPCSLTAIFADNYAAGFYSFKWSEMVAADVYKAFNDVGFENTEEMAKVGRRFRDTFLSYGGSVSAGEVFRRFRGRDPTPDALISYHKGDGN